MLNYFRYHSLRKSLWLIILLGSLITQTQNLFACDLMDNGVQTSCCCDDDISNGCQMGGGCEALDNGVLSGCCDTSTVIDTGIQELALGDSNHNKQVLSLDTSQYFPEIILITQLFLSETRTNSKIATKPYTFSKSTSGIATYQITNRFRI
ncbi:hypothetical protein MNBD_GAMMA22-1338 [hydrothermal vent metagenome]|uniref:Uncharacterized protein n=1 Tax=hydrothermal vent metagenome TaxID=652676 RepID=A0A3B0ZZB6_9ZZZZ